MLKKIGLCIGPYHECTGPDDCMQHPIAKHQEAVAYAGAARLDRMVRRVAIDDVIGERTMEEKDVRTFDTGATRSPNGGRPDPEGYMSPLVEQRFCEYMLKHQLQTDGTLRPSDNWQKGMPLPTYMQGMKRHLQHLWLRFRGWTVTDPKAGVDIQEDLCALLFNVQGYLHTLLAEEQAKVKYPIISVDPAARVRNPTGDYDDAYFRPAKQPRRVECLGDYEKEWPTDETEAAQAQDNEPTQFEPQWLNDPDGMGPFEHER